MAESSSPPHVYTGLVVEIVRNYVGKNSIPVDQLGSLIATVHRTLSGLGQDVPTSAPATLTPAVPIRRAVQPDFVVCLECGLEAKTLRRHLRMRHGLDPMAYRARWKLSFDHPLTAPEYSSRRSAMAKQSGLGQATQETLVPRESADEMPSGPRRRGRPRQRTS